MILEIRLSNFFSIKDEVVLDMQAASIQTKKAKELEENTAQLQISVAYFCSIGLYFLV